MAETITFVTVIQMKWLYGTRVNEETNSRLAVLDHLNHCDVSVLHLLEICGAGTFYLPLPTTRRTV